MLKVLYDLYQSWKMNRAMSEPSTGEHCVACEGTDVTLLGPAAYRCNTCGYEGGDGLATLQRQQRNASFAQMTEAERLSSARRDLHEAKLLLTSGLGDLNRAQRMATADTLGIGGTGYAGAGGEGAEKLSELNGALGLFMEAENHLRDAVAKIYGEGASDDTSQFETPGYIQSSLDIHFDNIISDLMFHQKLNTIQAQAETLLNTVERLQTQLGPSQGNTHEDGTHTTG
ncbi:MAG: hypothetical protein AAFS10_06605 [Myxococcota bacterium]